MGLRNLQQSFTMSTLTKLCGRSRIFPEESVRAEFKSCLSEWLCDFEYVAFTLFCPNFNKVQTVMIIILHPSTQPHLLSIGTSVLFLNIWENEGEPYDISKFNCSLSPSGDRHLNRSEAKRKGGTLTRYGSV